MDLDEKSTSSEEHTENNLLHTAQSHNDKPTVHLILEDTVTSIECSLYCKKIDIIGIKIFPMDSSSRDLQNNPTKPFHQCLSPALMPIDSTQCKKCCVGASNRTEGVSFPKFCNKFFKWLDKNGIENFRITRSSFTSTLLKRHRRGKVGFCENSVAAPEVELPQMCQLIENIYISHEPFPLRVTPDALFTHQNYLRLNLQTVDMISRSNSVVKLVRLVGFITGPESCQKANESAQFSQFICPISSDSNIYQRSAEVDSTVTAKPLHTACDMLFKWMTENDLQRDCIVVWNSSKQNIKTMCELLYPSQQLMPESVGCCTGLKEYVKRMLSKNKDLLEEITRLYETHEADITPYEHDLNQWETRFEESNSDNDLNDLLEEVENRLTELYKKYKKLYSPL